MRCSLILSEIFKSIAQSVLQTFWGSVPRVTMCPPPHHPGWERVQLSGSLKSVAQGVREIFHEVYQGEGAQCAPPPPPAPLKPNIGPRSCEASSPTKITSSLGCRSRDALRAAKAVRASRVITAAPARSLAVLAVNVDQRPVLLPSSRFRHNALFLSSFSCSLIAVELHCDAWCSHEVHSTLQPLCGSVRVRCCRIFVIALPWVRSKF